MPRLRRSASLAVAPRRALAEAPLQAHGRYSPRRRRRPAAAAAPRAATQMDMLPEASATARGAASGAPASAAGAGVAGSGAAGTSGGASGDADGMGVQVSLHEQL